MLRRRSFRQQHGTHIWVRGRSRFGKRVIAELHDDRLIVTAPRMTSTVQLPCDPAEVERKILAVIRA